ncbi:hypothetical protein FZEAL_321 [Fusarium zealandicum]|uniref:Uncharacterized protein n=1 Tax=Fusarium zealandicum TaxID=1053134 RepID=A0A8H4XPY4_9HYPO|nr:hypothetical protein FZEAL_321 [Fusarium zealandicum]
MEPTQNNVHSAGPVPTPESLSSTDNPVLLVNFTWRKFKALISEKLPGTEQTAPPKYMINYNTIKTPSLTFHPFNEYDKSVTFGSGTLHPVSIHADYELHGRKGTLKALKRWVTSYTHLSYNFSDNQDGSPAVMTWTSQTNFKNWDFICLDEHSNPVAKFSSNLWAIKKMGNIEFMGPRAHDRAAQEEILVVGMTLFTCMCLRINNLLSFFGSIFAQTGPIDKETAPGLSKEQQIAHQDRIAHQNQNLHQDQGVHKEMALSKYQKLSS